MNIKLGLITPLFFKSLGDLKNVIQSKEELFGKVPWPILYIPKNGTIDFKFELNEFITKYEGETGIDNRKVVKPKWFKKPWKWQEKQALVEDNKDGQTKVFKIAKYFIKLRHALKEYEDLRGMNMYIIKEEGKDVEFMLYEEKRGKINMPKLSKKVEERVKFAKNKTDLVKMCGEKYKREIYNAVKEGWIWFQ